MPEEHTIQIVVALLLVGLSFFLFGLYYGKNHAPCIDYFNPDECEPTGEDRYICPSEAMLKYKACLEESGDSAEKVDKCFWEYNKTK